MINQVDMDASENHAYHGVNFIDILRAAIRGPLDLASAVITERERYVLPENLIKLDWSDLAFRSFVRENGSDEDEPLYRGADCLRTVPG